MTPRPPGWGGALVMMALLVACTTSPSTSSTVEADSPPTAPGSTAPAEEPSVVTATTQPAIVPVGYRSVMLSKIGATLAIPSSWLATEMSDGDLDDVIGKLNPANQQLLALLEGAATQAADTYLLMAFDPTPSGYSDNVSVSLTPAPSPGTDLMAPAVSLIEEAGGTIVGTSGDPDRTAAIRYSLAVTHADGVTFDVHAISHVVATDGGLLTVTVASGTAAGLDEIGPQIIESLAWAGR